MAALEHRQEIDPSLVRGCGGDAPGPDHRSEPDDLSDRLEGLIASRLSRRDFLGSSAKAVAGGAVAAAWGARPALAAPPSRGDAESLSAAVDVDYLRFVTETVTGFGDTPQGWRPGGSPANEEAASWIADEMRRLGLHDVAMLPVPIDRWVFRGAEVAVDGGPTYQASSWGGVPGTPPGGIHAEVVDAGLGTADDFEGLDVDGKIVLVNWRDGRWWVNRHGHQATLAGAAAIIFYTGRTAAEAFYNQRDDALLGFDGTYDDDWIPFVFVTRNAARDLLDRVAAGQTFATLTSRVELTRAEDGGVGHNVIGRLPGRGAANELIVFTGHHDAWFRGAADDATAIAAMLGIAKAARDSGFASRRSLVFLASTNEEYGYTDAYYEWLIGCWYAVTNQKTEWQDKAILTLDFELLGMGDPNERLLIRTHSELFSLAQAKLEADPSRTPHGTAIQNTVWAFADHFTLTAAGIPGLYFNTVGLENVTRNYHTDFDTVEGIDFEYLKHNIEVVNDIWVEVDRQTLPILDFVARAEEAESRIAFVVDGRGIRDLPGTDQAAQDGLEAAAGRFREAAEALEARLEAPVRTVRPVAREMYEAVRIVLSELVALDVFETYVFPHQQLQRDATRMQLAIDALEAGQPEQALDFVQRTGLTGSGRHFAYETYAAELARHDPDFDRLQWGGQAHLSPYVDVWHEYHAIAAKIESGDADYSAEIASLGEKLAPVYQRLNDRLGSMADTFDTATGHLRAAVRLAR